MAVFQPPFIKFLGLLAICVVVLMAQGSFAHEITLLKRLDRLEKQMATLTGIVMSEVKNKGRFSKVLFRFKK